MMVNDQDKALLGLLSANSREPISELARKLHLARSTVKDRIERLERSGVITGYTLRFSEDYVASQIQAHVMIVSEPKEVGKIVRAMKGMSAVKSLHAVNGVYDMLAVISAESTRALDQALDDIGSMKGVEKTVSSIILSTKFER